MRRSGHLERQAERGSALTWALFFVVVVAGMIVSHTIYLASNRRDLDVRFRQSALSTSFARSGAVDALGWFQKQATQPVLGFTPVLDRTATPPVEDTIDPALGLVRQFEIRGGLWGRYEVRNAEVADVSELRCQPANSGSVWDITARGYLFERTDPTKPFDTAPNRIVAMTSLRTELRGIAVMPPSQAAICVTDGLNLQIGPYAVVDGGPRPALAYPPTSIPLLAALTGVLSGVPSRQAVVGYDAAANKVFKMNLEELGPMADVLIKKDDTFIDPISGVDDGSARVIGDLPNDTVVMAGKDLKFDFDSPLKGRVLLVVRGNLEIVAGGRSAASGLIYVTGDATIDGPFLFRGVLVVGGRLRVGQANTGKVQIVYDPGALDSLRAQVGRYRFSQIGRAHV